MYHCRPSELREESLDDILTHVALLRAEAEVRGLEQGLGAKASGGKKRGRVKQAKGGASNAGAENPG